MVRRRHCQQHPGWRYLGLMLAVIGLCSLLSLPAPAEDVPRIFQEPIQAYQIANLSDADEVALGLAVDQRLKQGELSLFQQDSDLVAFVSTVGQRLAAVSDRPQLPYRFQVVEDDAINAFATMGGFIYINTGLIGAAQNEAELASVLAHEIGHIEGRHGLDQLWHELIARDLSAMAEGQEKMLVDLGIELRLRSHSYTDEYDADQRGIHILHRAGYALSGAITFLQRLDDQPGNAQAFLYSHPAPHRRLDTLVPLVESLASSTAVGLDASQYAERVSSL